MTWTWVLLYIVIGLIVAKGFQIWMNKSSFGVPADMPAVFAFIIVWPACVFIRIIAWLIQLWIWFFKLWSNP